MIDMPDPVRRPLGRGGLRLVVPPRGQLQGVIPVSTIGRADR